MGYAPTSYDRTAAGGTFGAEVRPRSVTRHEPFTDAVPNAQSLGHPFARFHIVETHVPRK
jgi:hypothetical protein